MTQTQLSTSYGTAKALVASLQTTLLQTIYAGITLVRSSGQPLDSFGYAAFGLAISPYIIMPAINFLGNLRRHFFEFTSDTLSPHRRPAQALLTLASPSAWITRSRSYSFF